MLAHQIGTITIFLFQVFNFLDRKGDGFLDYLEWTGRLGLDSFSYVDQVDEDHRLLQKMVVQLAGKYGVKCLSAQVFAPANLQ